MLTNKLFICFRARVVPENIVKKQARDAKVLAAAVKKRTDEKKHRAEARKSAADRATKYAAEYAKEDADKIANRRAHSDGNSFFVDAEPKIAFVIRTRG